MFVRVGDARRRRVYLMGLASPQRIDKRADRSAGNNTRLHVIRVSSELLSGGLNGLDAVQSADDGREVVPDALGTLLPFLEGFRLQQLASVLQ